jgi:aspartate kinase
MSKPIVVHKYGGSSVSDLAKIQLVAQKIAATYRDGYDVVVVVSAMGNTTDELLTKARKINPEPSRRELDMLLSVGERISVALLSMAIHSHGVDAISFTGSQSGILTTSGHSTARIVEVRPYRIQDELAAGRVVIVAGYQGASYRREITTLGRGGSDTTAVALAAALGAEACEIYSDVDGIFSTDPRIVTDAHKLEEITYEEMQELARMGAKVLNATAVEFARRAGIALYARSTHSDGSGTHIHGGGGFRRVDGLEERIAAQEAGLGIHAVTGFDTLLHVHWPGDPEPLFAAVEDLASPWCQSDEDSTTLLLQRDDIHDEDSLRESLLAANPGATVDTQIGVVAAVGTGIGDRPRCARAVRAALAQAGVPILGLRAAGPSVSALISSGQLARAVNAVHGLTRLAGF